MKAFCEECRDDTEYEEFKTVLSGKIGDKEYSYLGRVARCLNCDHDVYVAEIADYNLDRLWDEFEKANPGRHRPNNN